MAGVILSEAASQLIESDALAHLVTLNDDDTPQVSLIWVGLDGDEIVSAHLDPNQQKLRNLRRDPRVVLSLEGKATSAYGLREYLVIHGRARLTEGGGPELLQRLAHVYIGPGVRFPAMDDPPPGVVCHITIDRLVGVGDWSR
ncbi:MAG: PPOX class F420-dependent oxidoreductase [Acidimicrobiales bacterium]